MSKYTKRNYTKRNYTKRNYTKRNYTKRNYTKRNYTKRNYTKRKSTKRGRNKVGGFNMESLNEWIYELPTGTELERYEKPNQRLTQDKFYSFFRKGGIENPWGKKRCINGCTFKVLKTTRPLRLLAIPYKNVTYEEEETAQDLRLAKILKEIDVDDKCYQDAINHLIELNEVTRDECRNPDWNLFLPLCKAGIDGWIRVINNTETENIVAWLKSPEGIDATDAMDEVAICNADLVTELVSSEEIPPQQ